MTEVKAVPLPGTKAFYMRGSTGVKYGLRYTDPDDNKEYYIKEGFKLIKKEDIQKDIQVGGAMSDFTVIKKDIDSYPGEMILFVIDEKNLDDPYIVCFTEEAKQNFLNKLAEEQEELAAQIRADQAAEEARIAAEYARKNVVYEDKPVIARPWVSAVSHETENEIKQMTPHPTRELIVIEVSRPKRLTKQSYKFFDRNAELVAKFQPQKDPNFKGNYLLL
jgi:hypothetical protein